MRVSRFFSTTRRDVAETTDAISHQLLVRAGYIRQLGQGLYSYLPLAKRSLTKIENIIREEMDKIGGQEITMPVVHPAEVWKATGRYHAVGPEMVRFKDRRDRDMVLAMTHEEVVADLCLSEIKSYRQLPQLVYQLQTKFRDDPRPRAGLIRVREFTMKDSYSLDTDEAGLDVQYRAHYQAYFDIFTRCGLPVIAVGSDVGMMGGSMAHEYMYLTAIGEDTLVLCSNCGYAANRQIANFAKATAAPEDALELEKVETPAAKTIEALANFLQIPTAKTAKAVMMVAGVEEEGGAKEQFVFAVIRGDMDVNETKLSNAVQANWLRPATEEEIRSRGAVPGYASPLGVTDALIVVDDSIPSSPNLVIGANEEGYHLRNFNFPRDVTPNIVADIAAASDGVACIECGTPVTTSRGVESGNIFKLGTRYSAAVGATFLDTNGEAKPIIMGSYGIGVGRLLACLAEEHHDDKGLKLPISVAPYHVYLVSLAAKNEELQRAAESLYQALRDAKIEVLYDDRDERAGTKFMDADLMGIPLRLTISSNSMGKGGIELKQRDHATSEIVAVDDVVARVQADITALFAELDSKVAEVAFK